jgi:hypothetical protein
MTATATATATSVFASTRQGGALAVCCLLFVATKIYDGVIMFDEHYFVWSFRFSDSSDPLRLDRPPAGRLIDSDSSLDRRGGARGNQDIVEYGTNQCDPVKNYYF